MSDNTLQNVKPGDTVLYSFGSHWSGAAKKPIKVDRVTASQIICGGQRFRKKDGYQVGGGRYSSPHIEVASEEKINAVRIENQRIQMILKISKITRGELAAMPHDALKRICDIIEEHQPKKPETSNAKVPD